MKITPSQLTIAQLLSSENEQFYIPAYQRRYAWTDKQLVELFEDIKMLDDNDQHFLGTILLLTEAHRANINMLEVVDGQQRIISLSLLLESIKDRFIELQKEDITRKIESYLFCQGLDRKKQNKILLGDLDEPDYGKVLQLKNSLSTEDEKQIKNQKLLNAYRKFYAWISEYSFEDLHKYYFKLMNSTIIVRLDTEKARDAYKLFETINNRGLRLSPTDIIKNFLLGHASLVGEKELSNVRDSWTRVIVSLDGIDTDSFFRHYLMCTIMKKITYVKLTSELKRYYLMTVKEAEMLPEFRHSADIPNYMNGEETDNSGNDEPEQVLVGVEYIKINIRNKINMCDYSSILAKNASIYANMINCEFGNKRINLYLYNLKRIESTPAYTFLLKLFAKEIDENEIIKILKGIEAFILRRHICERRTAELDDIFPKLVSVRDECRYEQIKEILQENYPDNREFREKFATYNHRRSGDRAKYILEKIEYHLIEDQGEYEIKSGSDVHLEHIIPLTISTKKAQREYGDWVTYLGKDAEANHEHYVDRIGNYTLLAQKLNITASNNPFGAKKREYRKSNIRMTKELASSYRAFRYKQVKFRSQKFAEIAVGIWSL
jgi:uncharacterized protein with ParB-like and HNH nuclease domain